MKTRIGNVYNAPIAVIDNGTLAEIGEGSRRFLARQRDAQTGGAALDHLIDPLKLLEPLMTPGQCTLVIPRFVVQEMFTVYKRHSRGEKSYYEYGPTQRAARSHNHAADIAIDDEELLGNNPGLCSLLENDPKQVKESAIPRVRYYTSPQKFIENGELEGRKGGIVIVDTDQPLNDDGQYFNQRSASGRGDEQIREILREINGKSNNTRFPVISSDYRLMNTSVRRICGDELCACKPFPMNLRALISTYEKLGVLNINENMAEALYSITNRARDTRKIPTVSSPFRDAGIDAAVSWLQALQRPAQDAGNIISEPQSLQRMVAACRNNSTASRF